MHVEVIFWMHISVSVLKDEISKEGDHIRRFHRLKLVSDRSPLFKMSWNVMHEIDENSPLNGVDWTQPSKVITSFIITINAHDQNYARSIYDRHIYYPQDIVLDAHFDDVIHRLNDGRWLLDLKTASIALNPSDSRFINVIYVVANTLFNDIKKKVSQISCTVTLGKIVILQLPFC